jgi:hypothetical protein
LRHKREKEQQIRSREQDMKNQEHIQTLTERIEQLVGMNEGLVQQRKELMEDKEDLTEQVKLCVKASTQSNDLFQLMQMKFEENEAKKRAREEEIKTERKLEMTEFAKQLTRQMIGLETRGSKRTIDTFRDTKEHMNEDSPQPLHLPQPMIMDAPVTPFNFSSQNANLTPMDIPETTIEHKTPMDITPPVITEDGKPKARQSSLQEAARDKIDKSIFYAKTPLRDNSFLRDNNTNDEFPDFDNDMIHDNDEDDFPADPPDLAGQRL